MALNKYMHPRNVYKKKRPDFKALAIKYSYFREKVTQNMAGIVVLDFKDPEALRALTQALLEDDFGLRVTLPLDRLIPTVPQRLNYILWLEDIVGQRTPATGIDIGTGASCIYPLLGCRQNGWRFLASELDDQNCHFAKLNIANNKMEDKITVKQVTESTILMGLVEDGQKYDFCMCNPPFFTDHLEAQGITHTRTDERPEPHSICTASEGESVAWGGEVRFVRDMMEESLKLKDKVRVYTSLLGRKMSLSLLKDELHKRKITNHSSTEFCQGKTMRWGIAWSFDETVQFPKSTYRVLKNVKPPLEDVISPSTGALTDYTVQAYTELLQTILDQLQINYHVKHSGKFYTCMLLQAKENTWSHQRRKRRQLQYTSATGHDKASAAASTEDRTVGEHSKGDNAAVEPASGSDAVTVANVSSTSDTDMDMKDGVHETINAVEKMEEKEKIGESANKAADNAECMSDDGPSHVESEGALDLRTEQKRNKDMEAKVNTDVQDEQSEQTRKRSSDNTDDETKLKRKRVNAESSKTNSETNTSDADTAIKQEHNILEHFGNMEKTAEIYNKMLGKSDGTKEGEKSAAKKPEKLDRKAVIERFWKEKSGHKGGKKKGPKSLYEKSEAFAEDEDCLLLCKLVLRKDDGVITFSLTYIAGNKEAMHQIMQYLRNKFLPAKKGQT